MELIGLDWSGTAPLSTWTEYRGYLMRSKLETKWAQFLDDGGIRWVYEAHSLRTLNYGLYLPDFWLFDNHCYLEVKRDGGDFSKPLSASGHAPSKIIILAEGEPHSGPFEVACYGHSKDVEVTFDDGVLHWIWKD